MYEKLTTLQNLLEEITGNEVDIEIISGNLVINITDKNKQVVPNPGDLKLPDEDEVFNYDFHNFISNFPEKV